MSASVCLLYLQYFLFINTSLVSNWQVATWKTAPHIETFSWTSLWQFCTNTVISLKSPHTSAYMNIGFVCIFLLSFYTTRMQLLFDVFLDGQKHCMASHFLTHPYTHWLYAHHTSNFIVVQNYCTCTLWQEHSVWFTTCECQMQSILFQLYNSETFSRSKAQELVLFQMYNDFASENEWYK